MDIDTDADTDSDIETDTDTGADTDTDTDSDGDTDTDTDTDADSDTDSDIDCSEPCDSPPNNYCIDEDYIFTYRDVGICNADAGLCTYDGDTSECNVAPEKECAGVNSYYISDADGYCLDDAGTGQATCEYIRTEIACDSPPQNFCQSAIDLMTHDIIGTCAAGDCDYNPQSVVCEHGCFADGGICNECIISADCGAGYECVDNICVSTCPGTGGVHLDPPGECWYLGEAVNTSCDTVCTNQAGGGYCKISPTDWAGYSGSNGNCQTVLEALGTGTGTVSTSSTLLGIGCWVNNNNNARKREDSYYANCSDTRSNGKRACACSASPPEAGCSVSSSAGCGGCPCEACVCAIDAYCCGDMSGTWDETCVQECWANCGGDC